MKKAAMEEPSKNPIIEKPQAHAGSTDLTDPFRALEDVQRATINILDDFEAEKIRLETLQVATMNLLEDFDDERRSLQLVQKATVNLLEDMNEERNKSTETQNALMNILEDMEVERTRTEQSKALVEAANKELEAFSYSVSHDLRAPLRAIGGFSEAIIEDYMPLLDDQGKRYLHFIAENANKMGQLIDDLLSFSRLGRQVMAATTVDLNALAELTIEELRDQTADREISFAVETVPPAYGDGPMLRQVLINLLSNAVKFTRTRKTAQIEFGYLPEAGKDAYYVRDNGVGFDMQYGDKLFGVFQRLHSVEEFEGTGVGLALVHRIITRHGGRVWAEGRVDRGATFYFSLPKGGAA